LGRFEVKTVAVAAGVFFPRIGGVELIADTLARSLSELSCSVALVTPEQAGEFNDGDLPYRVARYNNILQLATALRSADVVISFGAIASVLFMCRIFSKRTIVVHQIMPSKVGRLGKCKWFLKSLLLTSAAQVACSKALARRIGGSDVRVVPNPLRWDFDVDLDSRSARRGVLFCGRLVKEKGAELLLRAFLHLPSDQVLTIVGDGPDQHRLRALVRDLGIEQRVVFLGPARGIRLKNEYRSHQVLVVPSIWEEPFGIVALEGLAMGCEVVVTNRGGLPEAVGDLGLVSEPVVEGLACAIQNALSRAEQSMSDADRERRSAHLARHDPLVYAKELLDLAGIRSVSRVLPDDHPC
jgi:glycosyltransferase involved in cell wall biosynthesis